MVHHLNLNEREGESQEDWSLEAINNELNIFLLSNFGLKSYLQQLPTSFPGLTVMFSFGGSTPGQDFVQYSHCPVHSYVNEHQGSPPSIVVHMSWILFWYINGSTQFPHFEVEFLGFDSFKVVSFILLSDSVSKKIKLLLSKFNLV